MQIEPCDIRCADEWVRLREALWPDVPAAEHRRDIVDQYRREDAAAFCARSDSGEMVGFAETVLRRDYVNGCETSPVLFLEGIYVVPTHRREGAARALCEAVAAWGRARGATEFASDALLDNEASHAFHRALGFAETERVVYFRQLLRPEANSLEQKKNIS